MITSSGAEGISLKNVRTSSHNGTLLEQSSNRASYR